MKQVAVASDLLPALALVVLGLVSVRFSADAALVSAPLMAAELASLVGSLATASPRVRRLAASSLATILTAVTLIIATIEPRFANARAGRPCCDVDVDPSDLPLGALRFVEDNGLRERMYNDFETGSYLLFEGYPRYRVFVDPRLPAYPEEMHRLLGSFDLDRATWGAAMTRYGVQSALLSYAGINRRVAWWDPGDWALVYRAADSRVFVRRREVWRDLIAAREIPATFDFTVERGATTRPLEQKPLLSPVTECEWQRRLGDLVFDLDGGASARAHGHFERALETPGCLAPGDEAALAAWMGAIALDAPDGRRALIHLNRALDLSPADTKTRANRAIALERNGRRTEAIADWNRVATDARDTAVGDAAAKRARGLARVRDLEDDEMPDPDEM
jgi:tetratricopeptide (TPR) repeat protein